MIMIPRKKFIAVIKMKRIRFRLERNFSFDNVRRRPIAENVIERKTVRKVSFLMRASVEEKGFFST